MTSLTPLKSPGRLGRYEILDEIGKGAMGVVYLAKDPLIGRLVALKTFRIGYSVKDLEREQFRARFMREAQSAGILSHPNIVTIHDVVEESEEGLAFIAMEYVRGTNLKLLLQREGGFDLPFIAGLLGQIADALDYAHSKGVVHRDVKPANIIITADNRVKITDFGIARIDTSNLTQEGQLLGTPNYMAPEQIQGREVDHRSDIFSLGVVLYEMLTRHKPFQGENLTVVSHRIVYDQFTPLAEYGGNLPPGVEPILTRALEKDPNRRYQRAREMADDLSRLVTQRMSGEALNETLSMSDTVGVPALAPAVVPLSDTGSGGTAGSASGGSSASSPAVAAPAAPMASAPANNTAPRPSRRLAPALGGAVLLVIALVAALAYLNPWGGSRRRVAAPPPTAQPTEPAAILAQREAAARTAAEQAARQKEIADRLENARQALDGKRYDEAVAAASAVLTLAPGNPDAQGILTAVDKAQERQRARLAASASPSPRPKPTAAAPPVAAPMSPPPTVVAPVPTDATLAVDFFSNLPEGVLVVYVNKDQRMREPFKFRKKTGFLKSSPEKGRVQQTLTVPLGTADIRVYVTYENKRTEVKELSGNFPGGAVRTLHVTLNEDGSLGARLE
jgi:serine/threonine protein kinase